jgi:hypothetical protein
MYQHFIIPMIKVMARWSRLAKTFPPSHFSLQKVIESLQGNIFQRFSQNWKNDSNFVINNNRSGECLKSFGNPRTIITNKSKKILSLLFHFLK